MTTTPTTLEQAQQVLWTIGSHTPITVLVDALAAGADPMLPEPITHRTAMMILAEETNSKATHSKNLLSQLLKHGVNPLAVDCPFMRFVSQGDRWQADTIINDAIAADFRSDSGETIFHILAQCMSAGEQASCLRYALTRAVDMNRETLPHATDEDGRTPLHALWDDDSYAVGWALHPDEDERRTDDEEIEAHWYACEQFIEAGCSIEDCDNQGVLVKQMMLNCLAEEFPLPDMDEHPGLAPLVALLEAGQMDIDTPQPGGTDGNRYRM